MIETKQLKKGMVVIVLDLSENGCVDVLAHTSPEVRQYFMEHFTHVLGMEFKIMKEIENS